MSVLRHCAVWLVLAVGMACGVDDEGGDGASDAGENGNDPLSAERNACVERINDFRATEGLPPYERWTGQEACSDEQSELDAEGGGPHGNFQMCNENAQNTCPSWPSTDAIIQDCLQAMWDEGPGQPFEEHGHYINMSSTQYTRVACGFYTMSNGQVWSNQNFR